MFCPVCKDEFRPGFTRCAGCDVDLVDRLDPVDEPTAGPPVHDDALPAPVRMADYCGFFHLDDARDARERLRREGISSDILIREIPADSPGDPPVEEFWLRVDAAQARRVEALIGDGEGG